MDCFASLAMTAEWIELRFILPDGDGYHLWQSTESAAGFQVAAF